MDLTFGGRLRQQRERQQISLSAIAADTKIKMSLLEALERDDLSNWPQRIYRRAYIRSYARAIGLDPESVVREFIELYPEPVEANPNEPGAAADAGAAGPQPSSTIFRRLVTSAIGAVPAFLQRSDRMDGGSGQPATPPDQARRGLRADSAAALPPDSPRLRVDADLDISENRAADETASSDMASSHTSSSEAASSGAALSDMTLSDTTPSDTTLSDTTLSDTTLFGTARAGTAFETGGAGPAGGDHTVAGTSPVVSAFNLSALADLCTRLGRVLERRELVPLLDEAAHLFDAVGLIVWSWDPHAGVLRASVAYGYPDVVLAQWPGVPLDADNGIAAAFRSASRCVVDAGGSRTGAVVVPLLGPRECAGVLAIELRHGGERQDAIQAAATILAAQLVTLVGPAPVAEAVNS